MTKEEAYLTFALCSAGTDTAAHWVAKEQHRRDEAECAELRAALIEALDLAENPETEGYAHALTKAHRERVATIRARFGIGDGR